MSASKRIIANTLASYARLFSLAVVGLLATPIALRTLGTVDYGIFSVIGSSLTFLLFVNNALTTGAQRYIAYALGEGNNAEAARLFKTCLAVHILLSTVCSAVAFLLSHWILHSFLNIPAARLDAATWVYIMVIVAIICNLISTPYQALLMAHEKIVFLSISSCLGAALLLAGVLSLRWLHGDALLWFTGINSLSQVATYMTPCIYCLFRYSECRSGVCGIRRTEVIELLSFSGWNLFGALAGIGRAQGPAVLLNIFFGPMANASYGIAQQVNGFGNNISGGVLRATTPPIVKREAAGDRRGMVELSNLTSKYAFLLLWLVIGPLLLDLKNCLHLWLSKFPADTATFVALLLIMLLIDQMTSGFMASMQAVGRIAAYQAVVGSILCSPILVGYLLLYMHMPMTSVLWAGVGASILAGIVRLWFVRHLLGASMLQWSRSVVFPATMCVLVSVAGMSVPLLLLRPGIVRLVALIVINMLAMGVGTLLFVTTAAERMALRRIGMRFLRKSREPLSVVVVPADS
jgi:O-antigen/teichoic acid export membrane protein